MSSFRRKLARLDRPASGDGAGEAASLDRLRDRLAVALGGSDGATGQSPPASHGPGPDSSFRLATTEQATAWGPCHSIVAPYTPSYRVGDTALCRALGANGEQLSLLGLTPAVASCDLGRALYLDTETTGLGTGTGNLPFLIGLCWFDAAASRFVLEQLFLRDPDDEVAILERVRERVEACELIVSYNGKSFDMPVLRNRLVMNRREPLPPRAQLDLLHLARRVHARRSWRKSLTVVEREVLGFDRGPDVAGEDVAERYLHFLRSGVEQGLDDVVRHNESDVLSLVALVGWYGEELLWPAEAEQHAPAPAPRDPEELTAMARVIRRAGALDRAQAVAERAVRQGAGTEGLRVRGEIAKARGDKQRALEDFEAYAEQVSDPFVRLELAKLYEHYVKSPRQALDVVALGTAEKEAADQHRQARLRRKVAAQATEGARGRER